MAWRALVCKQTSSSNLQRQLANLKRGRSLEETWPLYVVWYYSQYSSVCAGIWQKSFLLYTYQGYAGRTQNGGTTVSGTMVLAQLAGIKVFATGGLGGVHRSGETTMDISADLTELGRTQMAVVSSGCKSFLDIPRTLEYLETQGVSVATFADNRDGQVNFPAFWTRDSGTVSPLTIRNEEEAAAMICKYGHIYTMTVKVCLVGSVGFH